MVRGQSRSAVRTRGRLRLVDASRCEPTGIARYRVAQSLDLSGGTRVPHSQDITRDAVVVRGAITAGGVPRICRGSVAPMPVDSESEYARQMSWPPNPKT